MQIGHFGLLQQHVRGFIKFSGLDNLSGSMDAVPAVVSLHQMRLAPRQHDGNAAGIGRPPTGTRMKKNRAGFGVGLERRERPVGEDKMPLARRNVGKARRRWPIAYRQNRS